MDIHIFSKKNKNKKKNKIGYYKQNILYNQVRKMINR